MTWSCSVRYWTTTTKNYQKVRHYANSKHIVFLLGLLDMAHTARDTGWPGDVDRGCRLSAFSEAVDRDNDPGLCTAYNLRRLASECTTSSLPPL